MKPGSRRKKINLLKASMTLTKKSSRMTTSKDTKRTLEEVEAEEAAEVEEASEAAEVEGTDPTLKAVTEEVAIEEMTTMRPTSTMRMK